MLYPLSSCYVVLQVLSVVMAYEYQAARARIISKEKQLALGGEITLTAAEKVCNERLLRMKRKELHAEPNVQPWTRNFISVNRAIEESQVFRFIRKVPKGASLHGHLYASVSYAYVVNNLLTRDNLYVCQVGGRTKLKFLSASDSECELLSEKRKSNDFDRWLNAHLLVPNLDENPSADVWDTFRKIFTFTYDLFSYAEVLGDYVYRMLLEHYTDNVTYVEIRSPFVTMYDLQGTIYGAEDFVDLLWTTAERFKSTHPDFVGMRFIYAQYRGTDLETVKDNLNTLKKIMRKRPGFVAGVDFVGFEEERALSDFVAELKRQAHDFRFYFHAGETNRQGATVDLNLVDAVLLNSKRIGHAYALPKHPRLMEIVKKKDIAIEVCPISNQVLGLVTDLRNHPATYLIARGYPVVICNDDPGNWGAEGLSYDWYLTFMAMCDENAGLELLKKLALNSLQYSALNDEEKKKAIDAWYIRWNRFIEQANNELI